MVAAWIVGLALVGAGVMQPVSTTTDVSGRVHGDLEFGEALASGDVDLSTTDGAVFAFGTHRTHLVAERLHVLIVEERGRQTTYDSALPEQIGDDHLNSDNQYHEESLDLTNVVVDVIGDADGVLFVRALPGFATFSTSAEGASVAIEAVEEDLMLWEDRSQRQHQTTLQAPLLGLMSPGSAATPDEPEARDHKVDGEEPSRVRMNYVHPLPALPTAQVEHLAAVGAVEAVIHRAGIHVTSDQGEFIWVAEHLEHEELDLDLPTLRAERTDQFDRYLVLSGAVDLTTDVRDAQGGLAGRRMDYRVHGALDAPLASGAIAGHPLSDDHLEAEGRFQLRVLPVKPFAWTEKPVLATPLLEVQPSVQPPRPAVRSQAGMDGEADALRVNDRTLATTNGPVAAAQQASQAAGLLVLLWVAVKKATALLAPLFIANPLDHAGRRALYDAVQRKRMVHLRELGRMTGMRVAAVAHHVEVLRRFGLVATIRLHPHVVVCIRSPAWSLADMHSLAVLADPTRERLAKALVAGGGRTQKELASVARVSIAAVSRQLQRLERAGLVVRAGTRNRRYEASALLQGWYGANAAAVEVPSPVPEPQMADTC